MSDRQPHRKDRTTHGTIRPAQTSSGSEPDDGSIDEGTTTPDLDERERRQSARRKPAGPGQPARPAPRPSEDAAISGDGEDADAAPEPWGCDPTEMPPTDPTAP